MVEIKHKQSSLEETCHQQQYHEGELHACTEQTKEMHQQLSSLHEKHQALLSQAEHEESQVSYLCRTLHTPCWSAERWIVDLECGDVTLCTLRMCRCPRNEKLFESY